MHAQAFKGIKSLITSTIFNALGPKGINPLWPGIGYAGPDPERPLAPSQERLKAEAVLQLAMLDLSGTPCKTSEELLELLRHAGKGQAGSCLEVSCLASIQQLVRITLTSCPIVSLASSCIHNAEEDWHITLAWHHVNASACL